MTEITVSKSTENQSQELVLLSQAHAALMEACTVEEVRDVRDRIEAVRSYAKKARLGREMVVEASALRLRSERRLGQLLQQLPLAKAARGNQYRAIDDDEETEQVRLQDVGITKSDSSRLQRIAAVPEDQFQAYVKECIDAGRECSTAACLRLLGPKLSDRKRGRKGSRISPALRMLLESNSRFATLLASPFVIEQRLGTAIDFSDLCRQPIAKLVTADSHLYLLTPDSRLTQALQLMEAWGFSYASCLPWQVGSSTETGPAGTCWSQQLLLIGRRGKPVLAELSPAELQRFCRAGLSDELMMKLIEQLSPGPYLDLTSNAASLNDNWTTISGGRVG
ncbi:MAG: hypothetical protein KDA96_09690 [Planctomycetaceae bacterium]|nr:hypothetical protein [Planctomycetaceae bacterium]